MHNIGYVKMFSQRLFTNNQEIIMFTRSKFGDGLNIESDDQILRSAFGACTSRVFIKAPIVAVCLQNQL